MLLSFLVVWVATALGLWLVARIVPGVHALSARGVWLAALLLGLVNATIRPVIYFLTLPLTLLTFGLFALVINAVLLRLVAWWVPEFQIRGFVPALLAATVLAVLSLGGMVLLNWLVYGGAVGSIELPRNAGIYM
jgi:putative membrane protein